MPTWYSIRNQLEAGAVKANNSLERFFTGFITAYGCIDVWYRSVASDSSAIECRIYYIQKDPSFTATNSWERDNERPEYWLQIKGSEAEIRASVISLLPHIAKLHTDKRHGEWNFGATQPFDGQGSIITVQPGTGNIVITGRFGDLALYSDGSELNWEDIVWEFDGCSPTATGPPADTVCFQFGNELERCRPTSDPTGTCLTGSCGNWTATAGQTSAECTAAGGVQWYNGVDLTGWTQDQWDADQSCPDPTGTCVTGTCGGGWTVTYPVTEAACSGNWYKGVDLTGQPNPDYWDDLYNCADPLGCCVVGSTCDWDSISVTTQSQCTALGGTWTEGVKGQACTIEQYIEDNGCQTAPPSSITFAITYSQTYASIATLNSVGFTNPYEYPPYPRFNGPFTLPAVTPGNTVSIPTFLESYPDCQAYTFTNRSDQRSQASGSVTVLYTFNYSYGDENEAVYTINSNSGHPGFDVTKHLVEYTIPGFYDPACGYPDDIDDDGLHYYQYAGSIKRLKGSVVGSLTRYYNTSTGNVLYTGGATFTPQNSLLTPKSIGISNVNEFIPASVIDSPSKWKSTGELPNDIFRGGEISIGNVLINPNSTRIWGDNITAQVYGGGSSGPTVPVMTVEAYRISNVVTETP